MGGIVAEVSGAGVAITNCYTTGSLHANNSIVGGLIGMTTASVIVTDCYSTVSVSGDATVGGLLGGLQAGTIENSYFAGVVSANKNAGGLVGALGSGDSHITNSYYNKETSGQNDTGKGVGVTTDELNKLFSLKTVYTPQETSFQIGINSDSASQITLDTAFGLNVSSLRRIGLGGSYLSQIDNMINAISAKQTEYGAAENRLESALEEISTQYDNLVSSRSTLRDADIAEVSSEYIRQQILQQASATLMATANQSPALALQLL